MPLRESAGNMYGFVTHTWNPIKGLCPHGCEYCYMHKWGELLPPRLDEKDCRTKLVNKKTGKQDMTIFVGSGIDMWADEIPENWIVDVLNQCRGYCWNGYLFQSKNPKRFSAFSDFYQGMNSTFCTTIETNRTYRQMGRAPYPHERAFDLAEIPGRRMVTIEPIMDFDLLELVSLLRIAKPEQVNIGADSKRHNLPEPPEYKVRELIAEVKTFANVHIKPNLARLMGGDYVQ